MARLEIRPFSAEFLASAGELLAARHRAHRAAEKLLPAQYEEPAAARAEVEALLALDGASGAVALRDGRVVGYLLGVRKNDEFWGANVWVELAGKIGDLVVERDGRIVGAFQLVPVALSSVHSGLARPDGAALLGWAATDPDVRGSGAGLALTEAAFAWARERGHETMVTDWRVTNLLSSRFWPARGFRPTFLRLYRHIP